MAKVVAASESSHREALWMELERALMNQSSEAPADLNESVSTCQTEFNDDLEKLEFALMGLKRVPAILEGTIPKTLPTITSEVILVEGLAVSAPAFKAVAEVAGPNSMQLDRAEAYQRLWKDQLNSLKQKVLSYQIPSP